MFNSCTKIIILSSQDVNIQDISISPIVLLISTKGKEVSPNDIR